MKGLFYKITVFLCFSVLSVVMESLGISVNIYVQNYKLAESVVDSETRLEYRLICLRSVCVVFLNYTSFILQDSFWCLNFHTFSHSISFISFEFFM